MIKQRAHSIVGIISFAVGVFNIIFSAIIFWALWTYINHVAGELLQLQVMILNLRGIAEWITKTLGLGLGITGLIQRNKKKSYAVIGTIINAIVLIWTLALSVNLII